MLSSFRNASAAIVVLIVALASILLLVLGLAVAGCTPPPAPPPSYDPSTCALACSKARELCGPATLKPRTGSCEDVCRVTEEGGGDFRTGCLSAQTTCAAVERCSK